MKIKLFNFLKLPSLVILMACSKDPVTKGCNMLDGFDNPCIEVEIDKPFTLKNRPDRAHPEGVEDVAQFVGENITYRFILFEVKDYRCDQCEIPSKDFYVKVAVMAVGTNDTTWVRMGIARDTARTSHLGEPPIDVLERQIGVYTMQFLDLEIIPGDYRLNLSTDYKEVTFLITK